MSSLKQQFEQMLGWLSRYDTEVWAALAVALTICCLVMLYRSRITAQHQQFREQMQVSQLLALQEENSSNKEAAELGREKALLLERSEAKTQELSSLLQHGDAREKQLTASNEQYREQLSQMRAELAELQARSAAEKQSLEEKLGLLNDNKEQLKMEFQLLANRIFEEKAQHFSTSSKTMLDGTLAPFREQLQQFRQKVEDVYQHENKERHLLKDQILRLREESVRIREDASNLAQALKADNKSQGNWGELSLVRALESCGLRSPEEYEVQVALQSEEGKRMMPDVVVHLPGSKDIIIDAKVSLVAYTRYFEAEDDAARQAAMTEHLASIKRHIQQLSAKSYEKLLGVRTLDYVMLYLPIEGAFALALQADRSLWNFAYEKKIVLVSPTNLLAILRSIETIWRHERQNKNAEEIARQAGNLHDKFVGMVSSLEEVGKALGKAESAYDQAHKQLVSGRGNLVSGVKRLEKLGAKAKKQLSEALVRDSEHTSISLEEQAADAQRSRDVTKAQASLDSNEQIEKESASPQLEAFNDTD